MLRKEDRVGADERHPEVNFAENVRIRVAGYLWEPVVPTSEDPEHGGKRQHVVEVRDHVICVLQHAIGSGIGHHDAGQPADREHEDEADRPQDRGAEFD